MNRLALRMTLVFKDCCDDSNSSFNFLLLVSSSVIFCLAEEIDELVCKFQGERKFKIAVLNLTEDNFAYLRPAVRPHQFHDNAAF